MNFKKGPFGGHHLGGDLCPPITFEVVPYENSFPLVCRSIVLDATKPSFVKRRASEGLLGGEEIIFQGRMMFLESVPSFYGWVFETHKMHQFQPHE